MKNSLWPAVALVALVVVGVVVLSATHTDVSSLERLVPLLVVPLLGYLMNQVSKVKEQTNGNTSALLDTINALRSDNARQSELLAQSSPVPADTPRAGVDYPAPLAAFEGPTEELPPAGSGPVEHPSMTDAEILAEARRFFGFRITDPAGYVANARQRIGYPPIPPSGPQSYRGAFPA